MAHLGVPHCLNLLIVRGYGGVLTKFQICDLDTFPVRYFVIPADEDKAGAASAVLNKILTST